ncbi:uncharacterized protein F5147DRAFT_649275 [Suillus discolor]|uniref:Uncharacterized protein n=1 Tax=Suillus discolor TaxID=1912936 RepID=A0A9P7FFK8_9AGAM|nr:uncharacterized protein F5147DRAFT_649275 [Suillus discolor]KAG2115832.1 hypothetical protein F5147DRAFT_649275 [Suillus discolor]
MTAMSGSVLDTSVPSETVHDGLIPSSAAADFRLLLAKLPLEGNCPDFTSADLQSSRAPLLGPLTTDEQAAAILTTIWTATNSTSRIRWQGQLAADALAAAEEQRIIDEASTQRAAAEKLQADLLAEEDKKKKPSTPYSHP